MIGTTLDGKYLINKVLGAGAMGQVYAAEHTATGRRVAVKVISSPDLVRDVTVISRFQREARVAGSIDSQHITQVLDAGIDQHSGLPFLVMEYMTGEDVQQLIKRLGPLAPDVALRITAQACLGLQKAHEAGVVHRDIKPANLFIARRDAGECIVKLLDFGVAKVKMDQAHDAENAALTRTGSMIGSPLYMSPEQARGEAKQIDQRADIWSLGIVLYQVLCGRTPYHHISALGQLIIAICSEWPQHIQEAAPWVPPEVASIVHRCLRHNPADRYQTAAEMFQAIRALLPQGWALNEDMLVSLQDTVRRATAEKLALSTSLANARTSVLPATHAGAATGGALTQTKASPPTSGGGKFALGFGAVVLVGAAVAGTYFVTRPHEPAHAAPVESTSVPTTVPPAAAPPPTPSASAPPPIADVSVSRVKVVIIPPDALIEVEGKPAQATKGLLELEGTFGSVRRLHVHKGRLETTVDVIITQSGPSPPMIELTAAGPKAAPPAVPAVTGTPPAAPTGIVETFH